MVARAEAGAAVVCPSRYMRGGRQTCGGTSGPCASAVPPGLAIVLLGCASLFALATGLAPRRRTHEIAQARPHRGTLPDPLHRLADRVRRSAPESLRLQLLLACQLRTELHLRRHHHDL